MSQNSGPDSRLVCAVLADRYGMPASELTRQGTVNYRAECADRQVFVKTYPAAADLTAERAAIELTSLAGEHGVPVPTVILASDGQPVDASSSVAMSVWEWMPGAVNTGILSDRQLEQSGAALGRIHAAFAPLPASPAPQVTEWRTPDLPGLDATIAQLLAIIAERTSSGQAVEFDALAAETLTERRAMLARIPALFDALPPLTAQVLHGDYSPVNLLFDEDTLIAVTDFQPPDPFLISFELGRVAYYPNTVMSHPDWPAAARTLILAYEDACPAVAADDVRCCARVALLQLLTSLYGVKQHYLKPGLFQDDLDDFWLLRHRTAGVLLDHLAETDALLGDLAAALPASPGSSR